MIPGDDERVVDSSVLSAESASTTDHGDTSAAENTEHTSATETTKNTSTTEIASTTEEILVEELLTTKAEATDLVPSGMESSTSRYPAGSIDHLAAMIILFEYSMLSTLQKRG